MCFAWILLDAVPAIIVLTIFLIALYFLPAIIANQRNHRNFVAILVVNVFFGWTILGWFAALIWSLTNDPQPRVIIERRN